MMAQKMTQELILPETELERRIVSSSVFEAGASFFLAGRRQKTVLTHVAEILAFIDKHPWQQYREDLRVLALLHDLGKYRVVRDETGKTKGESHAVHSEQIAREFINDPQMLYSVRIHDKYFGFYRRNLFGHFDQDKFIKTFASADLGTLVRFNYADSNDREKDSVIWFEDKAHSFGLTSDLVYKTEPSVLE
jgi:hypothetical protein